MKLILICLLFNLLYSQNQTNKDENEIYTYPYLATQFFFEYTENIVLFQGKTDKIKCYATKDIKVNDTLFTYDENEIISNINIILPDLEKITSIIKSTVKDIYIQNKFLLSIFIYHVLTNPKNKIPEYNEKLRLFILYFPLDEIYPIELLVDRKNIEEYLINKEWLEYINKNNEEINLISIIAEKCLDININNKKDGNYILFGKIYYFVKLNSFNVDGNAVILPFFDRCNVNPYYLNKNNLNYDSIFLENNKGKIIVKSKINIMQSDQFIFAYKYSLSNDHLLLSQGKVVFNNINDKYIIKKNFSFNNNNELANLLMNSKLNNDEIKNLKIFNYLNKRYANLTFEIIPNKINDFIKKISLAYFNNNILKSFTMIVKICLDELRNINNIIKDKFKSENFEDYLLKIQKEEKINVINSIIMKYNLAKINILKKNVRSATEEIIELNMNEIENLKQNYLKF